jgi:hypothetical protein
MRNLILCIALVLSFTACKKTEKQDPALPAPTGMSLTFIQVEENLFGANLYLYGSFGDSTASSRVKVSNVLLDGRASGEGLILEWKPYMIKVSIGDHDDNTGGGYVSVINGGKESNKRMLNVWELDMLYKQPDEGTILKEVRFKTFLRCDIDPLSNGQAPPTLPGTFTADSEAFWAIGGQGTSTYSGGGMTITLEDRNGVLFWTKPYYDATGAERAFQSEIQYKNGRFELTGLRAHKKKATKHSYLAHGSTVPHIIDLDFRVEVVPLNQSVKLELDQNNAIKAGTFVTGPHGTQYDFTWDANQAAGHMHNYTLQWTKAEPRFKKQ